MSKAVRVLGVDPGSHKAGLAVVEGEWLEGVTTRVLEKLIIAPPRLLEEASRLCAAWSPLAVVTGDRTGSRRALETLRPLDTPILTADEHLTSLAARGRYFADHPPRGLWKLIPLTMRTPPVPIDDYVAVILAERHIARLLQS